MTALDVQEHLRTEISKEDPWLLASNPFEHRRYAIMLDMIRAAGPFSRALEVGCAAGEFTNLLADHCDSLHVVDVLPLAIRRMLQRTRRHRHITCEISSVTEDFAAGETYDLIVVAEILCYLPDAQRLNRAIENLAKRLRPGGLLIFGSAIDSTCARWGLTCGGAETAMQLWQLTLRETGRLTCQGSYWGEACYIVSYTRDRDRGEAGPYTQEQDHIPFRPTNELQASSVLVLAPHPDDEVLGCGGAILRHVEMGTPVRVVIATSGMSRLAHAKEGTAHIREAESIEAAHILGYGIPQFWQTPDRALAYDEKLVRKIVSVLDDADLIYAPSPWEIHPDHRALSMAALEAMRRVGADLRIAFYEVGMPLQPNVLLDISRLNARKQDALKCFKSQNSSQPYDRLINSLNEYRTYYLSKNVASAEAFYVISAEALQSNPLVTYQPDVDRRLADVSRALYEAQNMVLHVRRTERERLKSNGQRIGRRFLRLREKMQARVEHTRDVERARMAHELDVERGRREAAEQALAVTRSSTSWRITAPLRAATIVVAHVAQRLEKRIAPARLLSALTTSVLAVFLLAAVAAAIITLNRQATPSAEYATKLTALDR